MTATFAREVLEAIKRASGLEFHGIINNSNLGEETNEKIILDAIPYAERLSEIMEGVNAQKVILCHEHRHGSQKPSVEDIYLTEYLKRYLEEAGKSLEAHYIMTKNDCIRCF